MRPANSVPFGVSNFYALTAISLAALATGAANAAVTISSGSTQNMTCSGGMCAPTTKNAVLNAGDLETMLASGNTTVTTTGSGVEADDIIVATPISWSASTALGLTAHRLLTVGMPVSVAGNGNLALVTDGDQSALSFPSGGDVTFANLASGLTINGAAYTLVDTVATLASAIRTNPGGNFAFAQSYNAKKDGTYSAPPITTAFTGVLEGLGNAISNLTISDNTDEQIGLFAFIDGGDVHDIGLVKAKVSAGGATVFVGTLAGYVYGGSNQSISYGGVVTGSWATGTVSTKASTYGQVGGLVGSACNSGSGYPIDEIIGSHSAVNISGGSFNFTGGLVGYSCGVGVVDASYAAGSVTAGTGSYVGGLVGASTGYVENSFASGAATTGDAGNGSPPPSAGGLVGYNFGVGSSPGMITNCYSLGAAKGGNGSYDGGLVGFSFDGTIATSYSTGAPSGGTGSSVGGLLGDDSSANLNDTYWDTDTSGITNLSQGAGNIANAPGITGLSTAQLQTGLPKGFSKKTWKEKTKTNGGLPYLIANPPPR